MSIPKWIQDTLKGDSNSKKLESAYNKELSKQANIKPEEVNVGDKIEITYLAKNDPTLAIGDIGIVASINEVEPEFTQIFTEFKDKGNLALIKEKDNYRILSRNNPIESQEPTKTTPKEAKSKDDSDLSIEEHVEKALQETKIDGTTANLSEFWNTSIKEHNLEDESVKKIQGIVNKLGWKLASQDNLPTNDETKKSILEKKSKELNYLYEKPVAEWDNYDKSNWKAIMRTYKSHNKKEATKLYNDNPKGKFSFTLELEEDDNTEEVIQKLEGLSKGNLVIKGIDTDHIITFYVWAHSLEEAKKVLQPVMKEAYKLEALKKEAMFDYKYNIVIDPGNVAPLSDNFWMHQDSDEKDFFNFLEEAEDRIMGVLNRLDNGASLGTAKDPTKITFEIESEEELELDRVVKVVKNLIHKYDNKYSLIDSSQVKASQKKISHWLEDDLLEVAKSTTNLKGLSTEEQEKQINEALKKYDEKYYSEASEKTIAEVIPFIKHQWSLLPQDSTPKEETITKDDTTKEKTTTNDSTNENNKDKDTPTNTSTNTTNDNVIEEVRTIQMSKSSKKIFTKNNIRVLGKHTNDGIVLTVKGNAITEPLPSNEVNEYISKEIKEGNFKEEQKKEASVQFGKDWEYIGGDEEAYKSYSVYYNAKTNEVREETEFFGPDGDDYQVDDVDADEVLKEEYYPKHIMDELNKVIKKQSSQRQASLHPGMIGKFKGKDITIEKVEGNEITIKYDDKTEIVNKTELDNHTKWKSQHSKKEAEKVYDEHGNIIYADPGDLFPNPKVGDLVEVVGKPAPGAEYEVIDKGKVVEEKEDTIILENGREYPKVNIELATQASLCREAGIRFNPETFKLDSPFTISIKDFLANYVDAIDWDGTIDMSLEDDLKRDKEINLMVETVTEWSKDWDLVVSLTPTEMFPVLSPERTKEFKKELEEGRYSKEATNKELPKPGEKWVSDYRDDTMTIKKVTDDFVVYDTKDTKKQNYPTKTFLDHHKKKATNKESNVKDIENLVNEDLLDTYDTELSKAISEPDDSGIEDSVADLKKEITKRDLWDEYNKKFSSQKKEAATKKTIIIYEPGDEVTITRKVGVGSSPAFSNAGYVTKGQTFTVERVKGGDQGGRQKVYVAIPWDEITVTNEQHMQQLKDMDKFDKALIEAIPTAYLELVEEPKEASQTKEADNEYALASRLLEKGMLIEKVIEEIQKEYDLSYKEADKVISEIETGKVVTEGQKKEAISTNEAEEKIRGYFKSLEKTLPGKDIQYYEIDFTPAISKVPDLNLTRVKDIAIEEGLSPIDKSIDEMDSVDQKKTYIKIEATKKEAYNKRSSVDEMLTDLSESQAGGWATDQWVFTSQSHYGLSDAEAYEVMMELAKDGMLFDEDKLMEDDVEPEGIPDDKYKMTPEDVEKYYKLYKKASKKESKIDTAIVEVDGKTYLVDIYKDSLNDEIGMIIYDKQKNTEVYDDTTQPIQMDISDEVFQKIVKAIDQQNVMATKKEAGVTDTVKNEIKAILKSWVRGNNESKTNTTDVEFYDNKEGVSGLFQTWDVSKDAEERDSENVDKVLEKYRASLKTKLDGYEPYIENIQLGLEDMKNYVEVSIEFQQDEKQKKEANLSKEEIVEQYNVIEYINELDVADNIKEKLENYMNSDQFEKDIDLQVGDLESRTKKAIQIELDHLLEDTTSEKIRTDFDRGFETIVDAIVLSMENNPGRSFERTINLLKFSEPLSDELENYDISAIKESVEETLAITSSSKKQAWLGEPKDLKVGDRVMDMKGWKGTIVDLDEDKAQVLFDKALGKSYSVNKKDLRKTSNKKEAKLSKEEIIKQYKELLDYGKSPRDIIESLSSSVPMNEDELVDLLEDSTGEKIRTEYYEKESSKKESNIIDEVKGVEKGISTTYRIHQLGEDDFAVEKDAGGTFYGFKRGFKSEDDAIEFAEGQLDKINEKESSKKEANENFQINDYVRYPKSLPVEDRYYGTIVDIKEDGTLEMRNEDTVYPGDAEKEPVGGFPEDNIEASKSSSQKKEADEVRKYIVKIKDPTSKYLDEPQYESWTANSPEEAIKLSKEKNLKLNKGDSSEVDTYDWEVIDITKEVSQKKEATDVQEIDTNKFKVDLLEDSDWLDEIGNVASDTNIDPEPLSDTSGELERGAWEIFAKIEQPIASDLLKEVKEVDPGVENVLTKVEDISELSKEVLIYTIDPDVATKDIYDINLEIEELIENARGEIISKYKEELESYLKDLV